MSQEEISGKKLDMSKFEYHQFKSVNIRHQKNIVFFLEFNWIMCYKL